MSTVATRDRATEKFINRLDATTIDWSDFPTAAIRSRSLLMDLRADPVALGGLVDRIETTPELLDLCECHEMLDYLVVYDALDRGLRIRIHMATQQPVDRPHDHRFSFSSVIMKGSYQHTLYSLAEPIDYTIDDDDAVYYQDSRHPDPRRSVGRASLTGTLTRDEGEGDCYTIDHRTIHATTWAPGTISMFLRGPVEKDRAVIMEPSTGKLWWRFGRTQETSARRADKTMSLDKYRTLRDQLHEVGITSS